MFDIKIASRNIVLMFVIFNNLQDLKQAFSNAYNIKPKIVLKLPTGTENKNIIVCRVIYAA
jgi:hypothetical protein